MESKIRVGAVSYLNTKPLVYGFEKGMMKDEVDLMFDYPARIAEQLLNGQVDIGLIPVAVIPQLKEAHIIPGFCIGASKEVASVALFSEVPIQDVTRVLVDYQSRTSAALLRILLKEYWKIEPELVDTREGYQQMISNTTAGLVIGDRALEQRSKSAFTYDLALAWQDMTGLPFVFAAWVANKQLPAVFLEAFQQTTGEGMKYIDEIVAATPYSAYDLNRYYTQNIDYVLDDRKKEGLELFLKLIR